MAAPTVREHGCIYFDWRNGKAGMIDARDVIDSAVGALTGQTTAIAGRCLRPDRARRRSASPT